MIRTIRCFITRSLKRQLVLSVIAVYLFLIIALIAIVIRFQTDILHTSLISRSQVYGDLVAQSSRQAVLTGDLVALSELLDSARQLPDVISIAVIDPQGKIWGHSDPQYIGKYMTDEKSLMLLKKYSGSPPDSKKQPALLYDSATVVESAVPQFENGRWIGVVRIRLSGEATLKIIQEYTAHAVLFGLLSMLIGSAVAFVVGQKIAEGLTMLSRAVAQYKTGGDLPEMPDTRPDEIGALAKQIKKFMQDLNAKHEEVRSSQEGLEHKVKERTLDLEQKTQELKRINKFIVSREIQMAELKKENKELKARLGAKS